MNIFNIGASMEEFSWALVYWWIVFVSKVFYSFVYMCKSISLVVDSWGSISECRYLCQTNSWDSQISNWDRKRF
jgi:hypothetical protein